MSLHRVYKLAQGVGRNMGMRGYRGADKRVAGVSVLLVIGCKCTTRNNFATKHSAFFQGLPPNRSHTFCRDS